MHALAESLGRADQQNLAAFVDLVNAWLSDRLRRGRLDNGRPIRVAEAWDAFNEAARETDTYNLDKRPLVFSTFRLLADTVCD